MKRNPLLMLLAPALLLVTASVRADDPAATGREIVAGLMADDKSHAAGSATLSIREYRGPYKERESLSDTRRRLSTLDAMTATGTFTYGTSAWLKDLTTSAGKGPTTRTRSANSAGFLRMLVESKSGDENQRHGLVLRVSTNTPADVLLAHKVGQSLADVQWTSARKDGEIVTLEGTRAMERHVLIVKAGASPQIQSWSLIRHLTSPEGQSIDQTYACDVTSGPNGGLAKLEESVINPPPSGNAAFRITEVKQEETLPAVKPEQLTIQFPKGTVVTDARGESPVEYEVAEEGLNEADVATAVGALAKDRVLAGSPAPTFELKDLKGKKVRLQDYRGKTLLLFWFSSSSKKAAEAAELLPEIARAYQKRGVQIVGLDVAEDADAVSRSDAYRTRYKWTFPVVVDEDAELLRRYGTEMGIPKVAVVDREGVLRYVQAGFDAEAVSAALERASAAGK